MLVDAASLRRLPEQVSRTRSVFARVEVFRDCTQVSTIWADLEASAPCSIYQTRAWLQPWLETLGRKAGVVPLFIVARGLDGSALALFCLGVIRKGPLRIATSLGGSDSNFNMPLTRPDVVWTRDELARLLYEAAKACGRDRPDVFRLFNQPFQWGGKPNPVALLPHQPSPSDAFGTTLPPSADSLFAAKLSKDTRKKLRKKEAKLAAIGPLTHIVVEDAGSQRRVIDSFIAQKTDRFRERGIISEFATPEMRAFIESASRPHGLGIELHALLAGERIVAIYGGAAHNGQWSGMFNAFDGDEEIAKSSPGDLLLMRVIAKACDNGLTRFDLGIGEARYKAALCDERHELFDALVPVSPLGVVAAHFISGRQIVKRAIKANPKLFALAKKVGSLRA